VPGAARNDEPPVPVERTEVDRLAEQMLSHLAVSEKRSKVLDPDELPGGKWAFIGGGTVAVLAVLLVLSVLITAITNR
jgi:hypothetical protein